MVGKVLGTLVLALGASVAQADLDCGIPNDATLSAIVRVQGEGVEGSGVVIDRNRVLTAYHVIDEIKDIKISQDGIVRSASIIAVDEAKDLAILLTKTGDQKPIRISSDWAPPRSKVWSIGYPRGGAQIATSGRVSSYDDGEMQTTASVDHGQSGGGMIGCSNGEHVLVGMIRAFGALQQGEELVRLDDFSVAVPAFDVSRFVASSATAGLVLENFVLSSASDVSSRSTNQLVRR